jgi:asparagine synthase (glutamine-hydrolysing)
MCGLAGKLSWNAPPDLAVVAAMTARLAHRGPDASGSVVRGPLALGHRRLSVIEPSAASDQPMADHERRCWLVFNGEIYNYRALRAELLAAGARFLTASDSEVVLEAYKRWGTGCFARFNGMFALALWDEPAQRLVLARDRLGKKPLFWYRLADGGAVFASELKALVENPAVPRALDVEALGQYLALGYVLSDRAIFRGIEKLPPATFAVLERDRPPRLERYWDLAEAFRSKRPFASEAAAAEEVASLLEDAVRLRLVSDVPLGAFLSGGLDSTAVVAAMARLGPPSAVRTFSIGFAEPSFSELDEARAAAQALGVDHHGEVVAAPPLERLRQIVHQADEPFADTSMIPTWALAEVTRRHVTVALTGDGGDELFAGYETYAADRLHRLTRHLPAWPLALARRTLGAFPASHGKVSLDYKLRKFLAGHRLDEGEAHYFWRTLWSPEEAAALFPDHARELAAVRPQDSFARHEREVADCHWLDRAQYVDCKTWLPDDVLVKVDRCTMAHGLEARSPFLDHRLVELAASLPPAWRQRGLAGKRILRASQRGRVPARVLARKKAGFNAPVAPWLGTAWAPLLEASTAGARGPLAAEPRQVRQLLLEHRERKADHGFKLFALLTLQLWAESFGLG